MPRPKNTSRQTLRVLQELMLTDGPHYAYNMAKVLGISQGTVYGILKRLKAQKYVETCWDVEGVSKPAVFKMLTTRDEPAYDLPESGKAAPRLEYQITSNGLAYLRDLRLRLEKPNNKNPTQHHRQEQTKQAT